MGPIHSLTGLRFVAAFAVVLYHLNLMWPFTGEGSFWRIIRRLAHEGFAGVPFFFVLSGFVLAYSYRDRFRQITAGSLWDYGVARLARIYPVYLLGFLLALTVPQIWEKLTLDPWIGWRALAHLLLLQSWSVDATTHFGFNAVGWTLSVEAFFYASLPLLIWLAARSGPVAPGAWYALASCFWVGQLAWVAAHPQRMSVPYENWACFVLPLARWPEFAAGVCLGLAHRDRLRGLPSVRGTAEELLAVAPLLAMIAWASRVPVDWRMGGYYTPAMMLVIAVAARERGWLSRLFTTRLMLFWGEASYSLYILHALVMWQVQAWLPARPWLREGTAIMTMLLASAICHRFVELPMRQRLLGWLRLCRTVIHHDSVPSRARAA